MPYYLRLFVVGQMRLRFMYSIYISQVGTGDVLDIGTVLYK